MTPQTGLSHVPLSQLSIDAVNVRRTGRGDEPVFVASIEAKGILEPLKVRANGKGYKVIDGGKRLASLQAMAKAKKSAAGVKVDKDYPVPVIVRDEDDKAARETSLMLNDVRVPMHPVDRFEAFKDLADGGMPAADIAARYAMKPKEVQQVLALAGLAPEIRDAWRNKEIRAQEAQLFTLVPNHVDQVEIFKRLKKRGHLYENQIKHEVRGAWDDPTATYVKFVGEAAYEKHGGKIVRDLFGGDHDNGRARDAYSDRPLARRLAQEKLQAKIDELLADGWSWAKELEAEHERWNFGQLPGNKRTFTPADKAKSGVLLFLKDDGKLQIDYGRLSPEQTRAAKAKKTKAKNATGGTEGADVSQALALRLSRQLTAAAVVVAPLTPQVALAAAISALTVRYADGVKLRSDGMMGRAGIGGADDSDDAEDVGFNAVFASALAMTDEQRLKRFASLVGDSFDFSQMSGGSALVDRYDPEEPTTAALICQALDGTRLNEQLRALFDAQDYFAGVNGALRQKAVAEAINADEAAKVGKMKKPDQVTYCVTNVPPTGWLPSELRTVHYDGPGAAKGEPKPAKKAKAAKGRKRG